MAAPISSFSKLSLNQGMQSPLLHDSSRAKGKDRAPIQRVDSSDSEDSDGNSDKNPDEEGEDDSDNGSSDDDPGDDDMDDPSDNPIFALDHCRQIGADYAFQLACAKVENHSIRVKLGNFGMPECSCEELERCIHIGWFLEQLGRTRSGEGRITPYEQISAMGLNNVCSRLHWTFKQDPDDAAVQWQLKKAPTRVDLRHQTRGAIRERMSSVRDVMATLSQYLPEDYRPDIFESYQETTIYDTFVPRDLEATISKLLMLDDELFGRLKGIVPMDVRASDYFSKMLLKAQKVCALMDSYIEVGPGDSNDPRPKHDLIWCAQSLVDIVNLISANLHGRGPLKSESREAAARTLVSILRMVVKDRNKELYIGITWQRRRPHAEPAIDRNLYLRLIGSKSNIAGNNFVISALQDLPEALPYVEDLEFIYHTLNSAGWKAPQAYLDKLGGIISQLKGGSPISGPGTSSSKRSAESADREGIKRMK